jgi:hypothetical protein
MLVARTYIRSVLGPLRLTQTKAVRGELFLCWHGELDTFPVWGYIRIAAVICAVHTPTVDCWSECI